MNTKAEKNVDIIIPVYNEEDVVKNTHTRICAAIDELPYQFTIYYIDDGSTDGTLVSLNELNDSRITVIELSRNFGHQAALTAG
ncbi:MAG TPA: glycosyltransferase, partial [Anaerolineales bacterium]|nr:glycosyltransferase [Anaerolineales bacterium]